MMEVVETKTATDKVIGWAEDGDIQRAMEALAKYPHEDLVDAYFKAKHASFKGRGRYWKGVVKYPDRKEIEDKSSWEILGMIATVFGDWNKGWDEDDEEDGNEEETFTFEEKVLHSGYLAASASKRLYDLISAVKKEKSSNEKAVKKACKKARKEVDKLWETVRDLDRKVNPPPRPRFTK